MKWVVLDNQAESFCAIDLDKVEAVKIGFTHLGKPYVGFLFGEYMRDKEFESILEAKEWIERLLAPPGRGWGPFE